MNYNFPLPQFDKLYGVGKLSISDNYICSFSWIGQKIKNYSYFNFLAENLEKFRSTELNDAPLEGSTIFLPYRSSLSHTALESSQLAELKYAIFSRTGRNTKKLLRSKLFLSTVLKHRLLEGLKILLQDSSISRMKLESSRLGEQKGAISKR